MEPRTYQHHRAEPYFTFLKNGQKTVEGRIRKGWYRLVEPGDNILVYNDDETDWVRTEVLEVRPYGTIREMLEKDQLRRLLPDVGSVEEGVEVYRRFYTEEQEQEFGVVAIEVKVIDMARED